MFKIEIVSMKKDIWQIQLPFHRVNPCMMIEQKTGKELSTRKLDSKQI